MDIMDIMEAPDLGLAFLLLLQNLNLAGALLALHAAGLLDPAPKRKKKQRSVWVRPYLLRRPKLGYYENLMMELEKENPVLYKNFMRLDAAMFHDIVNQVTPYIKKKATNCRKPLEPGLKVAVTLRFLATGESFKSLGYQFRVAPNTISCFVPQVCRAIVMAYGDSELRMPDSVEDWKKVGYGFEKRWNFPHVLGAIDGKHIRVRNPPRSGSKYYNYKKFYSIVMLAVADANYKFLYMEVGAVGSESDAGIYTQSKLAELMEDNKANFPPPEVLPDDPSNISVPYFLLGDDAFALQPHMMKPYPARNLNHDQRIYNYRVSRARRVVENAFGIMANRFRVFHTMIQMDPRNLEAVVMACCVLHNMMRDVATKGIATEGDQEDPQTHELIDGDWRSDKAIGNVPTRRGHRTTNGAKEQRDHLRHYVTSPHGSVPWQERMI